MARVSRIEIDLLLALLDEGFDRKAWHGPNLLGSLRGLSAEQALRRPAPGRHNVWEIAVHCAYWKSIVRRRLDPTRRRSASRAARATGRPSPTRPTRPPGAPT